MSDEKLRSALQANREWWEGRWAKTYALQTPRPLPEQVRRAWEEQWFPWGARLLEVGCGAGSTARWLARHGYRVTAVDIARLPLDTARRTDPGPSPPTFLQHDICSGPPPGGPFRALLDWGCLHVLPELGKEAYARNLAAVSEGDARLLLFHSARRGEEASVTTSVEELLAPEFELLDAEECPTAWQGKPRSGVALWFRRRSG